MISESELEPAHDLMYFLWMHALNGTAILGFTGKEPTKYSDWFQKRKEQKKGNSVLINLRV